MIIEMKDKRVSNLTGDAICRLPLERDVLPKYLMARRWYASKEGPAPSVTIEKFVRIPDVPEATVLILGVKAVKGPVKSYLFPIRTIWQSERPRTDVVCQLSVGPAIGWLVDGFGDDQFVRALLEGIRRAEGSPRIADGLVFCRSPSLNPDTSFAQSEIGRPGAEQSNTSVTAGEVMLKAFRKLEAGVHPELEMGKYLTETAGFTNVPSLLGSIEYVRPSTGVRTALCVLQSLIRNGKDGWQYVMERFKRPSKGGATGESEHELVILARKLGKRTAELHQAFGRATDNPDFKAEPISQDGLSQWELNLQSSISSVSESVASVLHQSGDADSVLAKSLVARKAELAAHVRALFPRSTKAKRTRLHGDFHLGQTVVTKEDVFIVDFEGEPLRSLAERRAKSLPMRDVAGMLRSLEYASAAAARDTELDAEASLAVQQLTSRMQWAFLMVYSETIAGCASFPEDLTQADNFLELCLIDKALYEVQYEIANRPAWINIPIAGLLAAMDGRTHSFGQRQFLG
jgi:trehalose synthase-fused probable maltokinase